MIAYLNPALRGGLALALLTLSSIAHAEWWEAETSHFIIVSESPKVEVEAFATRLERFDNALRFMQGLPIPGPDIGRSNKVSVYRFGDIDDIGQLYGDGGSGVAGFYIPRAGAAVSFVPAIENRGDRLSRNLDERQRNKKTGLTSEGILFHEYVHHFMLQKFSTAYPHWYVEGFAELYGTLELLDGGAFRVGDVPQHRGAALFDLPSIRLTRLFDHKKRLNGMEYYQSYSFGWMLAHYLNFDKERQGQLAQYLQALNAGEDSLTAANKAFGDLDKLQRELGKYQKGPFPTITIKPTNYVAPKVDIRRLTPAEAAVIKAHIRTQRGVTKRQARSVANDLSGEETKYPDSLAVQLITGEAYVDAQDFAKAEAALKRALVLDPQSEDAHILMGGLFMSRAKEEKNVALYATARRSFSEAYRLDPKDPRAAIGYYMSYYEAKAPIPEPAIIALESVLEYSSYDDGYRLILARQLLDENKGDLARSVLAPLAFSGHKQEKANKIAEIVANIDANNIPAARTAMAAIFAEADKED